MRDERGRERVSWGAPEGWREKKAHGEGGEIDLGGGGDNVGLVDPPQGDTVDLEGSGNEEETASLELLEEDDTLATEAAGEEDEDGSGGDGRAELGGAERLAARLGGLDVLRGVVGGGRGGRDDAGGAVGLAADGDRLGLGARGSGRGGGGVLALVESLLGEDLGAGKLADVGGDVRVACHR